MAANLLHDMVRHDKEFVSVWASFMFSSSFQIVLNNKVKVNIDTLYQAMQAMYFDHPSSNILCTTIWAVQLHLLRLHVQINGPKNFGLVKNVFS